MGTAQRCQYIADIVVTSDDDQILRYAARHGVAVRHRPSELAEDSVPLDPVVKDALDYMMSTRNRAYDFVVTLQPTSPLLSVRTLSSAIQEFAATSIDTLVSVVDDTSLAWREVGSEIMADYERRVNRQWLPKRYRETGAFLITRPQYVSSDSRFGGTVSVFAMPECESVDIDSATDWIVSKALMRRMHCAFVVKGSFDTGLGHIYRSLVLADALLGHDICFYLCDSDEAAIGLVARRGYRYLIVEHNADMAMAITRSDCEVVINDILDTEPDYVIALKDSGKFVVNFEDLGNGSNHADIVFNALYECTSPPANRRFGHKYVCLSPDFLIETPAEFRPAARNLLVTFGGTDQNNLTRMVAGLVPRILDETALEKVIFVVGPAFGYRSELAEAVCHLPGDMLSRIEILEDVSNMAVLMGRMDLAITSNGRTIYELAAMGVPTISISQNDRETMHLFARYNRGVRYIGMARSVSPQRLLDAIVDIANDGALRREMRQAQVSTDLRKGLSEVVEEIQREYWRWRDA